MGAGHGLGRWRRALRALFAIAAAIVVSGGLAAGAAGAAESAQTAGASVLTALSQGRTSAQWAYPAYAAVIRASPSAKARPVSRLQFLTSDEQAELYLALSSARLPAGQTWIQVRVPGRPNGRTGWVPRGALGTLHVTRDFLLVDRQNLKVTLFKDGQPVFSAPIGVGKAGTITPTGQFYVTEKLITLNDPAYGPYAVGTSAYAPTLSEWPGGGVVGIHGTNEPQLIPGRPSHGCIRLRDADISRLWHMIGLGTPIEVI